MKATVEGNPNYAANVVKLDRDFLEEAPGLDRLVRFPVLGHTALVERHIKPGYYIVFLAGTKIDPEYASYNNLYRDSKLNRNKNETGYLDPNGRIKAISLRKNYSNALVMPISSLEYTGYKHDLPEQFDHIGKHKICEKYMVKVPKVNTPKSSRQRIINEYFPEHYDTLQYWKASSLLNNYDPIDITVKCHGSSARFCHAMLPKKLSFIQKLKLMVGFKVQTEEEVFLSGSRRVIKDGNTKGFYEHDIWTDWGKRIQKHVPLGYLVYGEIVGYAENKLIQHKYDYQCQPGESKFFVYRVAKFNDQNQIEELNWAEVKSFCRENGLSYVPVLAESVPIDQLDTFVQDHMDKVYFKMGYNSPIPGKNVVDEGIVIRQNDNWLKAKCQTFLEYESGQADQLNIEDIESQ